MSDCFDLLLGLIGLLLCNIGGIQNRNYSIYDELSHLVLPSCHDIILLTSDIVRVGLSKAVRQDMFGLGPYRY